MCVGERKCETPTFRGRKVVLTLTKIILTGGDLRLLTLLVCK